MCSPGYSAGDVTAFSFHIYLSDSYLLFLYFVSVFYYFDSLFFFQQQRKHSSLLSVSTCKCFCQVFVSFCFVFIIVSSGKERELKDANNPDK